ncbi:hypothetical protein BS78_K095000 [Paspalum vaginatum]|uniref:F-box domain-containing protein n=1 Tax=Paspalum vaginatum TaxID=158149 RepID=A0A9W7XBU6_9POAL|nr:hypothetical protein BS78_K095000 [Paspalum vaginatum]
MAGAAAKRRRCTRGGITTLPEHALHEILSRVGNIKDLFMFAVTCRWWLRRFTDPDFLRELCPGAGEGHRARLLGFFLQKTRFDCRQSMVELREKQHASAFAPTFLPAPGSPLGPTDCALTSFIADDDGTFNYAEPLAARRGIVLMQLVPRTFEPGRHLLLGLCNPITGERQVLPPPESCIGICTNNPLDRDVHSYAIITAADIDRDGWKRPRSSSSGRFTFSQLLITTAHAGQLHLHSYSAATRSWSAPTVCLDSYCFSLLSVQVGTTRISMTKLPVRGGGKPLLCVSRDGKLAVTCVNPTHVTIWIQQADDDTPAAWPRTAFTIPLSVPSRILPPTFQPNEKWFDFNRGSMLALYRNSGVFIVDIEKKVMEKVMDCFQHLFVGKVNQTSVAYEMDLVEFFVLQLGGLCRGLNVNH